jgi:hypothetical protein
LREKRKSYDFGEREKERERELVDIDLNHKKIDVGVNEFYSIKRVSLRCFCSILIAWNGVFKLKKLFGLG